MVMHNTLENVIDIFDRQKRRQNLLRCANNLPAHNFLIEWAEANLTDRLLDINRTFKDALQIGTRNNGHCIPSAPKIENIIRMDIAGENAQIIAEEDFLPIKKNSLDLIFSVFNLHSVNDLPGALLQMRQTLKPDGLFIAAMLGGETLCELRESLHHSELSLKNGMSPRVAPFADKQQMGALLQRAGFALPVIDSEIVHVTYNNIFKLMNDLRGMGESNIISARNRKNPGKEFFMHAADHYKNHYRDKQDNNRIIASFEVIFLLGWCPDSSQQKPLKPGSAKLRLADALQTSEFRTDDKATP